MYMEYLNPLGALLCVHVRIYRLPKTGPLEGIKNTLPVYVNLPTRSGKLAKKKCPRTQGIARPQRKVSIQMLSGKIAT